LVLEKMKPQRDWALNVSSHPPLQPDIEMLVTEQEVQLVGSVSAVLLQSGPPFSPTLPKVLMVTLPLPTGITRGPPNPTMGHEQAIVVVLPVPEMPPGVPTDP